MSAVVETDPRGRDAAPPHALDDLGIARSDTALAFVVAPAVPSGLVALVVAASTVRDSGIAGAFGAFWMFFVVLAFGGYASALVVGVPAYVLIRWRTRVIPPLAATLTGGIVAALPWTVLAIGAREGALFIFATVVFGLGCIGGFSFSLIRDGRFWRADEKERGP